MESLLNKQLPKRYYIYGETGTGKTLFTKVVAEKYKSAIYKKTTSGYWLNYKGEKVVVIEDLSREEWEFIKFNLKKWLDYDTFTASALRDKMTKEELKRGEEIDASKYTLVITSYKPLEEFLNQERLKEGEKVLNDRDICKIERLIEVHELKHTKIEEIKEDILKILNE